MHPGNLYSGFVFWTGLDLSAFLHHKIKSAMQELTTYQIFGPFWPFHMCFVWMRIGNPTLFINKFCTPSEEKDILVCIITATQLSCNYKGTWLDRTSQG